MKIIRVLVIFIGLNASSLFSQKIGEQVIFEDNNYSTLTRLSENPYNSNRRAFGEFYRGAISFPKPEELKRGATYEKIIIGAERDYKGFYFKGKLKRSSTSSPYKFELLSDVRYVSNNQLYFKNTLDKDGNIPLTETMYYENGNVKSHNAVEPYENALREFIYSEDGTVQRIYNSETHKLIPVSDPKYGKVNEVYWSHYPMQPNMLSNSKGDSYVGYPHLGTRYTTNGYALTGFHYPLKMEHGNASVLFLENEKMKKYFWVLIIDGKIREMTPATITEKPNIQQLYDDTDTKVLVFKYPDKNDKYKPDFGRPAKTKDVWRFGENVQFATIRTKNIESHTGYGIDLSYQDNEAVGDKILLRVGFFKNGKLNGLGYDALLQYDIRFDSKNSGQKISGIDWKVAYGKFQNGEQSEGNVFLTGQSIAPTADVFSEMPYRHFVYRYYTPQRLVSTKKINFSELDKQYYVYSSKLNRNLTVKNIDYSKKTIEVLTDKEGTTFTFNAQNDKDLHGFQPKFINYEVNCPTTVQVDSYVTQQVPIYTLPGTTTTTKTTVNGVYHDKIITTRTTAIGETVYLPKSVKNGYKNVVCPKCNGSGKIQKTSQEGAFCEIIF